jgi:hypothetical protein
MPKTVEQYTEERKETAKKMLSILGINEDNKMFSLQKLDEDLEKQKKIMDLIEEIKKYFLYSRWSYFGNKKKEFKRAYLSIIKYLMKDMNIKMYSTFVHKKIDDKIKCETFYILDF